MRNRDFAAPGRTAPAHPADPASAQAVAPGRRSFLKLSLMSSGCLALGIAPALVRAQGASAEAPSAPHAFLIIAPDNTVTIAVNRLESGQGINTALPMALADELDADWSRVRTVLAPAGEPYKDPVFDTQMTGASTSLNHSFTQYRELGARARAMLVGAAARRWNVDPAACQTANSVVTCGTRSATYGELAPAAMALPVPEHVALKDPSQFRLIGTPTPRLDAAGALAGTMPYGADWRLPGMKVALVARPPRFGGQIDTYNASAAKAVKGVVAVVPVPTANGGTGVAVIADSYWPAKLGRDALQPTWKDVGSTVTSAAQMNAYKQLAAQPGTVVQTAAPTTAAPPSGAIQADYEFPYLAHAPMEPLSATVDVGAPGCACGVKLWVGSQQQTIDRMAVARALGVAPRTVQIFTMPAGGSYGRRATASSDYIVEAAQVANAYSALGHQGPVKVMWSREDDMRGGYYRPMTLHRVDIALDGNGAVQTWNHMVVSQPILKGSPLAGTMVVNGVDRTLTDGVTDTPYGFPMQVSVHQTDSDVPAQWWRSAGHTHTAFVMETLVDELAHAAKQDPVAYRMARLQGPEHARHRQALQLAVDKSGYGTQPLPAGHAHGVAMHESFGTVVAYVTEVSMFKGQPRVHRVTAGVHANRIVNPLGAEAQVQGGAIFAMAMTKPGFAIDMANGAPQNSNFTDYPAVRMAEAPPVDVHFVPSDALPTGLAESGVPPLAPSVANAAFALTGTRARALPFAPYQEASLVPVAAPGAEPEEDPDAGACKLPRTHKPTWLRRRPAASGAGIGQPKPVVRRVAPKPRNGIPCIGKAVKGTTT